MLTYDAIEQKRLEIQNQLDAAKTQAERNRLGQFATPPELAVDMLAYAKALLPDDRFPFRFLDPALGTGAFLSALLRLFPATSLREAIGYEVDPHYGQEAMRLWHEKTVQIRLMDYTKATPPVTEEQKAHLLICNPPYVRHHHLSSDEKLRLRRLAEKTTGMQFNELAGLYCYFLCIAHGWMAHNALAGWLIPSEFMDVNYGRRLKEYLLKKVTLLRIHRFDPSEVQFKDALVSSAVVWLRNAVPAKDHMVEFTFGGTLSNPKVSQAVSLDVLRKAAKWTQFPQVTRSSTSSSQKEQVRLADLFEVKRGLVTGANEFFILTDEQVEEYRLPRQFLVPILPGPKSLKRDEIEADAEGNPVLEQRLFLLNCNLTEEEVQHYPELYKYLQMGVEMGIHQGYICSHRSPWYVQEHRPPSMFLCNYMGRQTAERSNPFRFLLNHSQATAANVYLMFYSKPFLERALRDDVTLRREVWKALNAIAPEVLMSEGRVYGGGLYKLEPKELLNVPADSILSVLPTPLYRTVEQMELF